MFIYFGHRYFFHLTIFSLIYQFIMNNLLITNFPQEWHFVVRHQKSFFQKYINISKSILWLFVHKFVKYVQEALYWQRPVELSKSEEHMQMNINTFWSRRARKSWNFQTSVLSAYTEEVTERFTLSIYLFHSEGND